MSFQLFEAPNKIIVRMPNWIGDAVMAAPVLQALREQFPQAKITAMGQGIVGNLFERDPNVDEIFRFQRPNGWLRSPNNRDLISKLRRGQYDLSVILPNSLSSVWWMFRARIPLRLGYSSHWRRFILNPAIPCPADLHSSHLVHVYQKLLASLGTETFDRAPKLYTGDDEKQEVRRRLEALGITGEHVIIGVNPGAAYGSAKCWIPERFIEVAHELIQDNRVRILFFGDGKGQELVNQICAELPKQVINLAGRTSIRELMSFIEICDIFLTNDSGPMHMSAALGTPLLALFGSTNAVRTGPFNHGEVIHKYVSCSPCYKRTCPIDFRCMKRIESQEVYNKLRDMLGQ